MADRNVSYSGLPEGDRVRRGLAEQAGQRSPEAVLLAAAIGRPRGLGVPIPASAEDIDEPELTLYRMLCELMNRPGDDPYYRYNSWRRELDSFILALEARSPAAAAAAAAA